MDTRELRTRLIEAAAKHPHSTHQDGHAAGVLAAASLWLVWVEADSSGSAKVPESEREKLGLPKRR